MKALFGVCQTSPIAMADFIRSSMKKENLVVVENGKTVEPTADVLFFLSAEILMSHSRTLQKIDAVGVVFDCKDRLNSLSNLTVLDTGKIEPKELALKIKKAYRSSTNLHILPTQKKVDVITPILTDRKTVGFMHIYNTLLYTITNKAVREPLRTLIYSYMAGRLSAEQFKIKATPLTPKRGKGKDATTDLIDLMTSEQGTKLKTVLKIALTIKDPENSITVLAKKQGISAYDIRYFLSVMNKETKKSKGASRAKT